MPSLVTNKRLSRYLLGEVPEDERAEIEDAYLSDADAFDELLVAEDELIDAYVRGTLSRKDSELFERNFLSSPTRRERVKTARALMKFADMHSADTRVSWWEQLRSVFQFNSPAMRLVLASGFMVLVLGGPLVIVQMTRLRSDLRGLQSQQLSQEQRERELREMLARQTVQAENLNQQIDREREERGRLEQ